MLRGRSPLVVRASAGRVVGANSQCNQQNMLWAPEKNNVHTVGRFLRRVIDCRTRV